MTRKITGMDIEKKLKQITWITYPLKNWYGSGPNPIIFFFA